MNKKIFIKAALDGLIQNLILVCSGTFLFSVYAVSLSVRQYLLAGLFGAILSAVVYVLLIPKESNNKVIICFSLIGMLFFVLSIVTMLVIRLTFTFDILPLREVNNADGILFLFAAGFFVLASITLRVCIFVVLIVRNKYRQN